MTPSPYHRIAVALGVALAGIGCEATEPEEDAAVLVIGANLELSGPLPEVGRSSRRAAELFVADRNGAGGLTVGGQTLEWTLEIRDNRDDVDAAAAAAAALILDSEVLALVGPNISTSPSRPVASPRSSRPRW
jgi:branched-chain amino acid transport system substrate-binding protein